MIERNLSSYTNLIFRLAPALSEHGLEMPVLANTLFGPQFSFSQHFEQRNCSLLRFFVWHTVLDDLFQIVSCFYTIEQSSAINNLNIASALQLSKSALCNLKLCVIFVSKQKLVILIWVLLLPVLPFTLTLFRCDCIIANFAKDFLNQQDRQ